MNTTALAAALVKALGPALNGRTVVKARKGKGRKASGKLSDADKAAYMAANDAECVKVFEKAGFKDVQPRVNVLTYNKWIEKGRKVKAKEKSVRVNNFALFHIDQTQETPAANSVAA